MDIEEKNMKEFARRFKEFTDNKSLKIKSSKQFDSFEIFQGECKFVFDFSSNEIIYSKGFLNFLGYKDDELTFDFIFKNIHPNDVDMVSRIVRAAAIYCSENPKNSSDNLLSIKYTRKRKDGTYIKILSQSSIYDFDKSGQMTSTLIRFTDISFIDNSQNVNWDFKAPNLNKETFKQQIYKNYNSFFTVRETEIIFEIKNGIIILNIS